MDGIHERVEEAERGQARGEARRVEEGDETRERRRRGGGPPNEARLAAQEDAEVVGLGGDVGDGLVVREYQRCVSGVRAGLKRNALRNLDGALKETGGTYAAVRVEEALVRARRKLVQEFVDGACLVCRTREL